MHVVVCIKAVPGSTEVKMDPETHTIVRDGREAVINPFDASALELALELADARRAAGEDCSVTVVSMGIPATERILRDACARGATDALLLSDRAFAGADTLATCHALACGIRALPAADLILCGKMAVDGDTAQIGPELAGAFDLPCVTDVSELVGTGDESIVVRCGSDEGPVAVEAPLPCVLTVAKEAAQLRMPSIAGVRAAEDAPVAVRGAEDVGADPARIGLSGSPTQVVHCFVPDRSGAVRLFDGSAEEQAAALAGIIEEVRS